MKIFEYNLETKTRGKEIIGERSMCSGHGSGKYIKTTRTEEWLLLDNPSAVDRNNAKITASQFGKNCICFCLGEMTAGTDTVWSWVVTL